MHAAVKPILVPVVCLLAAAGNRAQGAPEGPESRRALNAFMREPPPSRGLDILPPAGSWRDVWVNGKRAQVKWDLAGNDLVVCWAENGMTAPACAVIARVKSVRAVWSTLQTVLVVLAGARP